MISCFLNITGSNDYEILRCPGVGNFKVFSGDDKYRNKIECAHKNKASIPPGVYWISDRPVGRALSKLYTNIKDYILGTQRSRWFALYRQDSKIDDETFYKGSKRNLFRLHPRGNESGTSWGCITFKNISDFEILRNALLQSITFKLAKTNYKVYGYIIVTSNRINKKCVE
ncbi:DUF2778 domain-containing protein [Taylorella equigenitalis]|uniref:Tlde1 domain-containing protein n=1 Tax=Taylorella equigenitalis (strain MCE9) TaxID=937774 RepID=A0A654KH50_TAYEM|nr:DUF2778 domain-containing protein [Taylorella equigenitalis]ADU91773.1 hypothetical protein TEQUI_0835 [Taylorella equigenitalis MCE9]WDU49583.1 DUF2778 domain-containing protein [Taylorella equigenitalis]WDU56553.1 DUF2778 domain-containing protein [Taylorella equigenitalis]